MTDMQEKYDAARTYVTDRGPVSPNGRDAGRFPETDGGRGQAPCAAAEGHRTALVTGASRGIGLAIAQALAAEGWDLILTCSRSMETLLREAQDLSDRYPDILIRAYRCDMGDPDQVRTLFREIDPGVQETADEVRAGTADGELDRPAEDTPRAAEDARGGTAAGGGPAGGGLHLVVNNAGIPEIGLLQDLSDAAWDRLIAVNLSSVFYTCRAAIPIFLRQRSGRIINISSVWGNVGASCEAAYSASKGGVNALTRALAKELAPSGIPVNAIACGCVDTRMNGHLDAAEKEALCEEIPAGRFAQPEEIAQAVLQLAALPAYVTGQILAADGGWT